MRGRVECELASVIASISSSRISLLIQDYIGNPSNEVALVAGKKVHIEVCMATDIVLTAIRVADCLNLSKCWV